MMKTVAIMPIKLNNERLPGKNTKMLGNKPLLRYELDTLLSIPEIDEIYVYCSDEYVCDFLPEGVRFLKRPKELDSNSTNFSQVFDAFVREIYADVYVYAHATAPFVKRNTIIKCLDAVKHGGYDSSFCAEEIKDFLWTNGTALNFDPNNVPRSQDLEPIYRETSGVYIIPREMYVTLKRRIGNKPFICKMTYLEAIDINCPEDFEIAESMLQKYEQEEKDMHYDEKEKNLCGK